MSRDGITAGLPSEQVPRAFVIAEAGVNHNGDLDLARRLVDLAAEAGVDSVKFQTFRAEALASASAPKAAYQQQTTGTGESQLAMLRRLELSPAAHRELLLRAEGQGLEFMSTPFDSASLQLLLDLGLRTLKLGSGELTNGPLLLQVARSGLPLILSTGMSDLDEVAQAVGVLAFGWLGGSKPGPVAFAEAAATEEGQRVVRQKLTLLQCTTEYPAPFADVNLRAMDTLAQRFGCPVGFSDHTPGIAAPVAAVARGARVIEKHFTTDKALPGPDHRASLEPAELAAMVAAIRQVEQALGDGSKRAAASELGNRGVARKSIVAATAISAGAVLTEDLLACKRPGGGLSPMAWWDVLGTVATRDYAADEPIEVGP